MKEKNNISSIDLSIITRLELDQHLLEQINPIISYLKSEIKKINIKIDSSPIKSPKIIFKNKETAISFVDFFIQNKKHDDHLFNFVKLQVEKEYIQIIIDKENQDTNSYIYYYINNEDDNKKIKALPYDTINKNEFSVLIPFNTYNNFLRTQYIEKALKSILQLSAELNHTKNTDHFFDKCLNLLIIFIKEHTLHNVANSFLVKQTKDKFLLYSATGKYQAGSTENYPIQISQENSLVTFIATYTQHINENEIVKSTNNNSNFETPNETNKNHLLITIKFNPKETYWIGFELPSALRASTLDLLNLLSSYLVSLLHNSLLQNQLFQAQHEVLNRLCGSVESRSKETGAHIHRVSRYSTLLCQLINLDEQETTLISSSSSLHDIGKVVIPDHILQKNGSLDEIEWAIIKNHPKIGYDLLQHEHFDVMNKGAIISYTHHEKWDGSGYPRNLSGLDIPIEGRIVGLVDVFDALLSKKSYKHKWNFDDVIDHIIKESGKHFDPTLVEAFVSNKDKFHKIFLDNPDEEI